MQQKPPTPANIHYPPGYVDKSCLFYCQVCDKYGCQMCKVGILKAEHLKNLKEE